MRLPPHGSGFRLTTTQLLNADEALTLASASNGDVCMLTDDGTMIDSDWQEANLEQSALKRAGACPR